MGYKAIKQTEIHTEFISLTPQKYNLDLTEELRKIIECKGIKLLKKKKTKRYRSYYSWLMKR